MTDKEIRDQLEEFVEEIFTSHCTREKAKDINRRIDDFCIMNKVSAEQMNIIAESGAGEMLAMLIS